MSDGTQTIGAKYGTLERGTKYYFENKDGVLYCVTMVAKSDGTVIADPSSIRALTASDVVTITGGAGQTADVKVTLDSEGITGTVTANLSATDNAVLDDIAANQTDGSQIAGITGFRSSDSTYQPLRLDKATNTLQAIDYAHHEIHAGSHFMYTDAVELNSAATQDYLITTPNTTKWAHMIFVMDGSAITQWQLYEGSDKTGTTAQTVGNNNRNSATAATITIHKGTSGGTTDGNLIHLYKGGSATQQSRGSSDTRNDEEIILKQNTKYILRVTSGTNANLTNLRLSWYEHTDIA